ncbi:MAG: hypothetical protein GY820_43320 [Gammaproteobacteria bacterium]|nr:hypothetical protein [Gammaproteobacteria bacterium]
MIVDDRRRSSKTNQIIKINVNVVQCRRLMDRRRSSTIVENSHKYENKEVFLTIVDIFKWK